MKMIEMMREEGEESEEDHDDKMMGRTKRMKMIVEEEE